jgi:outer membrane receptor protein involved in Fe transport
LHTIIGLQARYDNIINSELSSVKQRSTFLKPISFGSIQEGNAAVYIDESIELFSKLSMNFGLRYDGFYFNYDDKLQNAIQTAKQIKGTASPKASITYTINKQLQVFGMFGKSFHSNDTRVVVAQNGKSILPNAFGSEIGTILKPNKNLIVNMSLWQLNMQQEFVYVGDEAVVEAGEASRRVGLDVGIKYQLHKYLFADADFNIANGKYINAPKSENVIALAPNVTSIGGFTYNNPIGLQASLRYRHLANRAANETNSVIAHGYTLLDAVASYSINNITYGISAENVFNAKWKEAQFETETKLKNELVPISEIHFTAGTPFQLKFKVAFQF